MWPQQQLEAFEWASSFRQVLASRLCFLTKGHDND